MNKKIIPLIVGIVVLGIISYFTYDYIEDKLKTDEGIIEASGIIEVTTVTLKAKTASTLNELKLSEGQTVKEGEVIAEMDDSIMGKKIKLTRAEIEVAKTQIDAAILEYNNRVELAEKQVELSKSSKEYLATYHHYIYYDEPLSITESESESTSTSIMDSPLQGETETETEGYSISTSINYPGPSQKKSVRAQLQDAINQYDLALLKLKQAKKNDISIKLAEDNLKVIKAKLDLYEQQLKDYKITSPIEGVVLDKFAEEGEYLLPGSPVYEIANLYEVTCNIYVPEDKYGKIFLNQKAIVKVDSYPNEEFTGYVSKISDEAEFTPKNIQTREERVTTVYKITITIDNPYLKLKPGMPADVVIRLGFDFNQN